MSLKKIARNFLRVVDVLRVNELKGKEGRKEGRKENERKERKEKTASEAKAILCNAARRVAGINGSLKKQGKKQQDGGEKREERERERGRESGAGAIIRALGVTT